METHTYVEHALREKADRRVVAAVYADQNGAWDARNARNEIIAVGSGNDPQPQRGQLTPA